jgi:superkiller protein 3
MNAAAHIPAALLLAFGLCLPPAGRALAAAPQQKPLNQTRQRVHVADPLDTLRAQIDALIDKKDFPAAVEALGKYLTARPEDAAAHFQLGYAYTGLHRWTDAQAEYRKAIGLDPRMAPAYQNLGLSLLDSDPAAAIEPLQKAVELQPDKPQPHYLLAVALEHAGKDPQAIEQYQAAEKLGENSFDVHYNLALLLLNAERPPEAEAEFRRALALRSDFAPAHAGLAESLLAQKKADAGVQELRAFLQLSPHDPAARLRLAALLADGRKYDQALAELDQMDAAGAATLPALRLRGEIYIAQKDYAAAASVFAKGVALAPGDAGLRARLGHALLEKRDFPAAQRELTAALHGNPRLTDALGDLMAAFYLEGNYTAALQALDLLDKRVTPPPSSWFVRATCYDKLGQKKEALEAYRKFLELDRGQDDRESFQARQRAKLLERELEKK